MSTEGSECVVVLKMENPATWRRKKTAATTTKKKKAPYPPPPKKKKAASVSRKRPLIVAQAGPIWTVPPGPGPIHPQIDAQLVKPELATIYIEGGDKGGLRSPLRNRGSAVMPGLHSKMQYRYFRNTKIKSSSSRSDNYKGSSKKLGSSADKVLENAIRFNLAPLKGDSVHAYAVWEYWQRNNHRPVLAQLPVVMMHANTITAGDYFTIHTCPKTQKETLWLWELKTGYKTNTRKPMMMSAPLDHVPLTPRNRFQLQVLLTRLAYENELRMKIHAARVIHVWEVADGKSCDVEVLEPMDLDPPNWTLKVDKERLYSSLADPSPKKDWVKKTASKNKNKKKEGEPSVPKKRKK